MSKTLQWRDINCSPAVFKTSVRPPFDIPSDQVSSWTKQEVKGYKVWRGKGSTYTREDYRQFLIDLNKEFDMEEVFNQLEAGLAAFDKLLAFRKQFPNYDMNLDLDKMYETKQSTINKDFIKCGVQFVGSYDVKENDESEKEESDLVENAGIKSDNNINCEEMVGVKDEVTHEHSVENENLSQVKLSPASSNLNDDEVNKSRHSNNIKRKKEKRKERLLKFHQKLVDVSGLPPSRLMQELHTPRLSSAQGGLNRRSLNKEFENGGGAEFAYGPFPDTRSVPETGTSSPPVPPPMMPAALMPGQTCGVQPHTPAAPPGCGQPLGLMAGTTSGSNLHSSLSPIHQSFNGTTSGTVRWSEARPMEGSSGNGNTFPTPGPVNWSTSGSLNLPALSLFSPPSAWSAILPPYQPKPQPVPQVVTPAYCFHCMQYGAVFTIIPA